MSEDIKDVVPQILMKIQEDIAAFRKDVGSRFDRMEERLDRVESVQKQERRNSAAMLVMMRGVVGVYEERMTAIEADRLVRLEDRVTALEGRGR